MSRQQRDRAREYGGQRYSYREYLFSAIHCRQTLRNVFCASSWTARDMAPNNVPGAHGSLEKDAASKLAEAKHCDVRQGVPVSVSFQPLSAGIKPEQVAGPPCSSQHQFTHPTLLYEGYQVNTLAGGIVTTNVTNYLKTLRLLELRRTAT